MKFCLILFNKNNKFYQTNNLYEMLEVIILCIKIRFAHQNGWTLKLKIDKETNTDVADIEVGKSHQNLY
jgi:hypothetical protein